MPSLFTSETPSSADLDDGQGLSTSTTVMFAVAGWVTHLRFYAPATISGHTFTGRLYVATDDDDPAGTGAGTALGSGAVTFTGVTASAWNQVELPEPVAVDDTHAYKPTVHSSAGRFVSTASFFAANLTNGDIEGIESGTDPAGLGTLRNGTFNEAGTLAYPSDVSSASCYFVDVVFVTELEGPVEGTADLAATAALSGSGTGARAGTAALNASAGLVSSAETSTRASAGALDTSAALTGAGTPARAGTAALSATAGLTSSAETSARAGTAPLGATGALTDVGVSARAGTGALSATAELDQTATAARLGTAVLSATAALTNAGSEGGSGPAALNATASLTISGYTVKVGTAELNTSAALTGAGRAIKTGTASLGATAGLAGVGLPVAALRATAALTATGVRIYRPSTLTPTHADTGLTATSAETLHATHGT